MTLAAVVVLAGEARTLQGRFTRTWSGLPGDDAPYLWFRSGQVVVTLSGAATTGQLIATAESLTH